MNTTSCQKFFKNFHKFTEDYNKEVLEKVVTTLSLNDEDKTKLTELFSTLSSKADFMAGGVKSAPKKKRAPTAYNLFMKDMIKELLQKHPDIDKKELMSMGAREWQSKKQKDASAAATPSSKKK
jgi:hypothetical protein